jgi:hypothetical protein
MDSLAGILELGHTPAFRTNHPHAIKSADGKGDWKFSTRANYARMKDQRSRQCIFPARH